jgi:NAD+ synthase (glutamine-hydrolysing)
MYIALVQNNPKMGALRENAERALESLDALAASPYPPDLVIFPAFALTGSPVDGLCFSDAFAIELLDVAHAFMGKASVPTLIGTLIPRPMEEIEGFASEPEALFCRNGTGGALGFVDIGDEWGPSRYAASVTTVIDGHTITVLLDDYPEPGDDFSNSDVVVMLLAKEYRGTNTMFTASDQLGYLRGFARANGVWVVAANLVGAQDGIVYDGASVILRPDGTVATAAEPFVEQTLTCNISLDGGSHGRGNPGGGSRGNPGGGSRSNPGGGSLGNPGGGSLGNPTGVAISGSNLKGGGFSGPTTFATPSTQREPAGEGDLLVKPLLPYEADWRALELCIHDYVHKNGFTDVVIGLSGGIDSAVTAALAVDALGSEHVHGVLMPGPYSSQGSIDDALVLAHNLGIETFTMPITEPLETFRELSRATLGQEGSALARQNIQARIRTIHLMHLSNTFGWLLLNTGNKSEAAMGYSTLYGDTAGALAPLGNVYKTDVYGLAHWRNGRGVVIPAAILEKAPSAELYDGQTDQDSLPPYDLLDRILRLHIEDGLGVDQILEYTRQESDDEGVTVELVEQVLDSVRAAEYKRRQEPLAPSLGYLDMVADRAWPLTNGFKDYHRDLQLDGGLTDYLGMIRSWKRPEGWDFLAN